MQHQELTLERQCRELARLNGWVAAKLEKNGLKGIPDDLFLHPSGATILIEFKKDEHQHPRPEQQRWLDKFPQCHLCGSVEQFKKALNLQ